MASHWNARGVVDGFMPKAWAAFLIPALSVALFALFLAIPKIDPLRRNIEAFREYFDAFVAFIVAFLFYVHLLMLAWNLGMRFDFSRVLMPALAFLFFFAGVLIEKAKRNWFVGIRTPWTLSSDLVWRETHRVGAKLFKALAVVTLIGVLFPEEAFVVVVAGAVGVAVFLVVYSYYVFSKEKRGEYASAKRVSRGKRGKR